MILYFVTDLNPRDAECFRRNGVNSVLASYWVLRGDQERINAKLEKFDSHIEGSRQFDENLSKIILENNEPVDMTEEEHIEEIEEE